MHKTCKIFLAAALLCFPSFQAVANYINSFAWFTLFFALQVSNISYILLK